MPKLKQFSGKEIVRIFEKHGFEIRHTVGSHVRLTLKPNNPLGGFASKWIIWLLFFLVYNLSNAIVWEKQN
ncbi:TPA: hypothetical protein DEW47_00505 [Patescibacteria group bacterium]|nr:hypothetical protein [Patescibacteria group bacterium]HCI04450.1 hypothetical protein [Patescibacteria group bacterium]